MEFKPWAAFHEIRDILSALAPHLQVKRVQELELDVAPLTIRVTGSLLRDSYEVNFFSNHEEWAVTAISTIHDPDPQEIGKELFTEKSVPDMIRKLLLEINDRELEVVVMERRLRPSISEELREFLNPWNGSHLAVALHHAAPLPDLHEELSKIMESEEADLVSEIL